MLKHHKNILTRSLPKTRQEIIYQAGDDGNYEGGWWRGRLNANNRIRFIAKTIAGDDIVIDRATGLMWAADGWAAGCNGGIATLWTNVINICNALNFAGHTDWRLPNIFELFSILKCSGAAPFIDALFTHTYTQERYWSSTTYPLNTSYVYAVHFATGDVSRVIKTGILFMRAVRGGL
jgi:hypothetical protein